MVVQRKTGHDYETGCTYQYKIGVKAKYKTVSIKDGILKDEMVAAVFIAEGGRSSDTLPLYEGYAWVSDGGELLSEEEGGVWTLISPAWARYKLMHLIQQIQENYMIAAGDSDDGFEVADCDFAAVEERIQQAEARAAILQETLNSIYDQAADRYEGKLGRVLSAKVKADCIKEVSILLSEVSQNRDLVRQAKSVLRSWEDWSSGRVGAMIASIETAAGVFLTDAAIGAIVPALERATQSVTNIRDTDNFQKYWAKFPDQRQFAKAIGIKTSEPKKVPSLVERLAQNAKAVEILAKKQEDENQLSLAKAMQSAQERALKAFEEAQREKLNDLFNELIESLASDLDDLEGAKGKALNDRTRSRLEQHMKRSASLMNLIERTISSVSAEDFSGLEKFGELADQLRSDALAVADDVEQVRARAQGFREHLEAMRQDTASILQAIEHGEGHKALGDWMILDKAPEPAELNGHAPVAPVVDLML